MTYLSPSEYSAYGLEPKTPPAWVASASSLVDAHCRRASLLVAQYVERLRIRAGRNTIRLSYLPLAVVEPATSPLVSARARYAVPRRDEGDPASPNEDIARVFGLPGTWTAIDPAAIDFDADTGELTLPSNALGLAYNEVEITYTAGLPAIPDAVKFACAQIVRNAQATPALNVRAGNLDRMHLEYFSDTLIDSAVRAWLAPYVAQKVG
ncbi:MAG TPA: hypothetical protein VNK82_10030 [Terriglobales bacterium]|nr:hypothetical protein [Terriglobales bacterium]